MLLMWGFETTAQPKKVMVPPSMHHLSHLITLLALKNMNVQAPGYTSILTICEDGSK